MNGADDNGGRTANSRAKSSYYKIKPAAAAAVYIIIAGIWIFYTDNLVDRLAEPDLITGIQIIKGLFFVAVTGFIFYIVYSKAYLSQKSASEMLEELTNAHETLLSNVSDYAMFLLDDRGFIKSWNEGAKSIKGYKSAEIIGEHFSVFYSDEDKEAGLPAKILETAAKNGRCEYEGWRLRRDGSRFWANVALSAYYAPTGGRSGFIKITRDLTERKALEEALKRKVRALKTLSDSNQALVGVKDESEIMKAVCRVCVERGGYRMAWIGLAEDDIGKTVSVAAFAGHEEGYLDFAGISWEDNERGRGPTGKAIRTGEAVIASNIAYDSAFKPWRDKAIERGYASSAAFPLKIDDNVVGALNIYAVEPDAFDEEEVQLLTELTTNVSFGIKAARTRKLLDATGEAIAKTEEKHRLLFDHLPIGIYRTTPDGRILMANKFFMKMLGYSSFEEISKLNLASENHYLEFSRKEFVTLMEKNGEALGLENVWKTKDGTEVYLRESAKAIHDDSGSVLYYDGIVEDITEMRSASIELESANKALKKSEEKFRAIVNASKDGMIVIGEDGRIRLFNPAAETMFERKKDEMLGQKVDSLISAEFLGKHISGMHRLLKGEFPGGISADAISGSGLTADGKSFPVEFTLSEGTFEDERIFLAVVRDVTERTIAEEALRKSEERYRRFFEEDLSGDFMAAVDGKMLDCNKAFAEIFGYESTSDALAGDFKNVFPNNQALFKFISDVKEYGKLTNCEMTLKRQDGRNVFALLNAIGEFDDYGGLMAIRGYVFDMTKQKMIEEQLRHSQKLEAVGRLAGGIAHDFNNLLTGIIGYSEIVHEALGDNKELQADVDEVLSAARRAADLVSKLMVFSRQQDVKPVDLNLNEVIIGMFKLLKRVIGEHVELEHIAAYDLGTIHADRTQVEQVIMNLSVNARDAMPRGGQIILETENVFVSGDFLLPHPWAEQGRYVLLTVTDSGAGMTSEVLQHVFEPFFTTKNVGEGTGLGLATVYGIVKKHGGIVHVYSESPMGSTIKVYFPLKERSAESVGSKIIAPISGGDERILLAEDETMVQDLVTRVLGRAGYKVRATSDGREAVSVFESSPGEFDLVLLDLVMPKMSGIDAYTAIKEINPQQKFLFSSGYTSDSKHAEEAKKYCNDLIDKPYNPDELLRIIRKILDRKPQEQSGETSDSSG